MQPCKTPEVTGDAEVCIMPLQHLAQSVMLNVQRPMHHHAALLIEPPERARKPFFRRELAHNLVAFPRDTPRMEEPEEYEGRRQRFFTTVDGASHGPEVDQPSFVCIFRSMVFGVSTAT